MLFTLSYDLRAPGRNYRELYSELARLHATHVLESLWTFEGTGNAQAWRVHFLQFIDDGDGLFVCDLGNWSGWRLLEMPPGGRISG